MSLTLKTTLGDIKVELFCQQVPKACKNFLALAASGYYDGTNRTAEITAGVYHQPTARQAFAPEEGSLTASRPRSRAVSHSVNDAPKSKTVPKVWRYDGAKNGQKGTKRRQSILGMRNLSGLPWSRETPLRSVKLLRTRLFDTLGDLVNRLQLRAVLLTHNRCTFSLLMLFGHGQGER